ncbi:MAG: hypothetical protein NVS4B3_10790 [Gemmatimonadaceae bacterium]
MLKDGLIRERSGMAHHACAYPNDGDPMLNIVRPVIMAGAGLTLVACAAVAPSAPRPIVGVAATLDGTWEGTAGSPFWYSAILAQSGESITGTGARGPRPGSGMLFPSVLTDYRGTFRPPRVELMVEPRGGQPLRFVGEIESATSIRGTLTDVNGVSQLMVLRRQ